MKEEDLAIKIIEYLENKGFESYKEVSLKGRGGNIRSDCYFVKDDLTISVETKCSMTIKVLEQSYNWRNYASQVYVCVPAPKFKARKSRNFILEVCKKMNIGVFYLQNGEIVEKFTPTINTKYKLPKLYEEQKYSRAGNSDSEFYTSFKNTVKNINNFMSDKESYKFSDMIKEIEHHYRTDNSAKSSVKKMIKLGVINGYKIIKEGKNLYIEKQ